MSISFATRRLGIWSAAAALACSLAYIIAQLFEWAGMLGSAGGPDSASTPLGIVVLLAPSLLLGPAFVVLCAALHIAAPNGRKAYTLAGLAFAIMYATLTGMVYFVQLTFVAPRIASGETAGIELLLFVPYESFLFAIDLLGYSLMSAATLLAAFGLPQSRTRTGTRRAMIANGAILPFLVLQMPFPALIWPAALWAITFPLAMALLLVMFRALPASVTGEEPA